MKFEIIKNSESKSGFDVPDKEYKGQVDGLVHGWSFEFVNDKGEIRYRSSARKLLTLVMGMNCRGVQRGGGNHADISL